MTTEPPEHAEKPAPALPRGVLLAALAAGGRALGAGGWFHRRRRSGNDRLTEPQEEQDLPIRQDSEHHRPVQTRETLPQFQQAAVSASYLVEEVRNEAAPASPIAAGGGSGWFKDLGSPD